MTCEKEGTSYSVIAGDTSFGDRNVRLYPRSTSFNVHSNTILCQRSKLPRSPYVRTFKSVKERRIVITLQLRIQYHQHRISCARDSGYIARGIPCYRQQPEYLNHLARIVVVVSATPQSDTSCWK